MSILSQVEGGTEKPTLTPLPPRWPGAWVGQAWLSNHRLANTTPPPVVSSSSGLAGQLVGDHLPLWSPACALRPHDPEAGGPTLAAPGRGPGRLRPPGGQPLR